MNLIFKLNMKSSLLTHILSLHVTAADNSSTAAECRHYTSQWQACSKSCDQGLSTRIRGTGTIDSNNKCIVQMETRLCTIRQCNNTHDNQSTTVRRHAIVTQVKVILRAGLGGLWVIYNVRLAYLCHLFMLSFNGRFLLTSLFRCTCC